MFNKPHGRDLRKGRVSISGQIYLVTTITHDRKPVFADWQCGRAVVKSLMAEQGRVSTLAFVVMPDHLHWLLQLDDDAGLERVVRNVKSWSARRINTQSHRQGQVWQRGFHDHALRREEDVQAIARYVVANPLRAGLVKRIGDYPLWDAVWL